MDLYVFKAEDGSQRRRVVGHAGWPTWADENTVYFHRLADDGWWSIFKVNVSDTSANQGAFSFIASDVIWFPIVSHSVVTMTNESHVEMRQANMALQ